MKLRSKVVEIEAVLWDGEHLKPVTDFLINNGGAWSFVNNELKLWNKLENQWINCPAGHYVLRGLRDELYPCESEALWMKYEVIDD